MANNKIQIKRSQNTSANSSVPAFSNGELAFTANGAGLWIGLPDGTANMRVGGQMVPGTLTANQALVANATSGIDKIIVANAAISQLNANGATGTAGQVLKSGGAGSNSYWDVLSSGVAGTDTQVQYNDGGVLAGAAGLTFTKASNNVTIANNLSVTANVASNNHTSGAGFGGASAGATVNASTIGVSTNTTVNTSISATQVQVANSTGIANLNAVSLTIGTSVVNSTVIAAGANVIANTTALFVGNTTVNAVHSSALVQVASATSVANLTAGDLKIGATTVVNSSQITATLLVGNVSGSYANITGQVNTATLYAATSANIASAVQANSLGVFTTGTVNAASHTTGTGYGAAGATVNVTTIGVSTNSTVNASVTSGLIQVINSTASANITALGLITGISVVNTTVIQVGTNNFINATALDIGNSVMTSVLLTLGGQVNANGGVGTAGQVLTSGAAGNSYWTTPTTGTVTSVGSGNGLTGGAITTTGTLSVVEGVGLSVNATGVHVKANSGIIANSTGTFVAANTTGGLLANSTLQVKIGSGLVFDGSGNVAVNASALSFTDLTVSGNLTVLGDLVSLNVATLSVEDSLITLAKDQSSTATYTDAVDVGFIAPYGNTAAANANWTGLFRDQSDSGIYKLFNGNIPTPTSTVDTANLNFAFATLQTQLRAGGVGANALFTNTSHVIIAGNSTVNVFVTANTLSTGGTGANALIANSSHVNITANSTTNVFIVANTLSLSTALPFTSGGTGLNTVAVGDLLVGNSTNTLTKLTAGTDGLVLQINGTGVVAWNTLDGGTF